MKFGIFRKHPEEEKSDKMNNEEKKDSTDNTTNETQKTPPVIETTTLPTPTASPTVVKVIDHNDVKKPDKDPDNLDASKKPSPLRQLLPIGLFLVTFATVLSLLILYLDTSAEIRHQQFRLNMTRDLDLNINQDDPSLVSYVRNIHMKKYPMSFLEKLPMEHFNYTNSHDLVPEMGKYIANDLLKGKKNGVFFQSLTGSNSIMLTAPWLMELMDWQGAIVEPDPRKYFNYRRTYAHRDNVNIIHACLSPHEYPKEVTLHYEDENEVKVDALNEESEWFHSRVKCFPLYTLLLAINTTKIDLLSLGCQGQELQILQTIPFNKVKIQVISIHLIHHYHKDDLQLYLLEIVQFLRQNSFKLLKVFDHKNFVFYNEKFTPNLI